MTRNTSKWHFLIAHLKNYEIPLQGLGIGKQLKWLTETGINE